MTGRVLALLALLCSPAHAGEESYLTGALQRARVEIDAAVAARPPVRVPPVPVKVSWRVRKIGVVDAGAPLLALAVAGADLVVLSSREVLFLPVTGGGAVRARTPLPPGPPPLRPRDPVGSLVVAPGAPVKVRARSSELAGGIDAADFPLCTGGSAALAPGRNYFVPAPAMWGGAPPADVVVGHFHAVACDRGLVDRAGWPLAVVAVAGTDARLLVRVARSCPTGDASCDVTPVSLTIPGVGTAVAVADVDHDGRPEVIAAGAGAPGDPDQVSVYTIDGAAAKKILQHPFPGGGVVAIAAGDIDGDGGDEVFAASRLLGSNQVTLWSLE